MGSTSTVDVAILGGGPAGTAAALTLLKREGVDVAVLERTAYDAPRIGESLSPGIRPLLGYLDVWDAFRAEQSLDAFGSRAAWGQEALSTLDYLFTVHGSGWSLDRVAFDRMLAHAVERRGGRLLCNTRAVRCERTGADGWQIALSDGRTLDSRFLIDAAGRNSPFAPSQGTVRVMHDRQVGLGRIGRRPAGEGAADLAVEVEAVAYGWWYTAPIPNGRLVTVLMTDGDLAVNLQAVRPDRWDALRADTRWTKRRTHGVRFDDAPRGFPCHSSVLRQVAGDGWVAVGDAAAAHDPLSSSGIPHAVGSGVQGALVAADALFAGGRMSPNYQRTIHQDFRRYRQTHWQMYAREGRWPDAPFWARRRTPVQVDPEAEIACVEEVGEVEEAENGANRTEQSATVHLAPRHASALRSVCRPGMPVHAAVRAFADAHPAVPDERIILAVQDLIATGAVTLADSGSPTPTDSQDVSASKFKGRL